MSGRAPVARLLVGWAIVLALGVWSATVVVLGVRRDLRAGEAAVAVSLGEPADWQTVPCRDRQDPGMGGLLTYVLIIPAIMFLLLAVVLSFVLARRGRTAPLVVSVIITLGVFLAFVS